MSKQNSSLMMSINYSLDTMECIAFELTFCLNCESRGHGNIFLSRSPRMAFGSIWYSQRLPLPWPGWWSRHRLSISQEQYMRSTPMPAVYVHPHAPFAYNEFPLFSRVSIKYWITFECPNFDCVSIFVHFLSNNNEFFPNYFQIFIFFVWWGEKKYIKIENK